MSNKKDPFEYINKLQRTLDTLNTGQPLISIANKTANQTALTVARGTAKLGALTYPTTLARALPNYDAVVNRLDDTIRAISDQIPNLTAIAERAFANLDAYDQIAHRFEIPDNLAEAVLSMDTYARAYKAVGITTDNYHKVFDPIVKTAQIMEVLQIDLDKDDEGHAEDSKGSHHPAESYSDPTESDVLAVRDTVTEIAKQPDWQDKLVAQHEQWQKNNPLLAKVLRAIVQFIKLLVISVLSGLIVQSILNSTAIRKQPTSDAEIVTHAPKNTTMRVVDDVRYYLQIEYKNEEGVTIQGFVSKRSVVSTSEVYGALSEE